MRSRFASASAVALVVLIAASASAVAADPIPAPSLWSFDAPITRNQTIKLVFQNATALATEYRASNDSATANGVLTNGVSVPISGDWTLASGPDGTRTVYGQVKYTDDTWSAVVHLDFQLITTPGSSLYVDLDTSSGVLNLSTPGDWHTRTKKPADRIFGRVVEDGSVNHVPVGFHVGDDVFLVSYDNRVITDRVSNAMTVGTHTCSNDCLRVHAPLNEGGMYCMGSGDITIYEIGIGIEGDLQTLVADFRVICFGAVMAGSIRYGSDQPMAALDQNLDTMAFGNSDVASATASQTVTFTNFGDVATQFGQALLGGSAPADYEITSDTCSNALLPVGANCQVAVRFKPTARGIRNSQLSIPDPTARGSRYVRLVGTGMQPVAMTLAAPVKPAVGPGVGQITATLAPPPLNSPGVYLDGVQLLAQTTQTLTNPARIVYTFNATLTAGHHVVTGQFDAADYFKSATATPLEFDIAPGGDTAGPTGTASINNGAAQTNKTAVTVAVPATDPAGVSQVALSNDGTAFVTRPYAVSQAWTLTGGDGAKDVFVKWRDNLGNWSAVRSDRILLDTTAPNAVTPTIRFVDGGALNKGRVKLRAEWTATDAGSGIGRYELRLQTDGVWSTLSESLTKNYYEALLAPGHTYVFRVRPWDKAGNYGAWRSSKTVPLVAIQDASPRITYLDTWSSAFSWNSWGNTTRKATATGASASFTFTGRSLYWIAPVGPTLGQAQVLVNGAPLTVVDLYASTAAVQKVVLAYNWSTVVARTVTINVVGTTGHPGVAIDGFVTADY